jgi:hypothetical protein
VKQKKKNSLSYVLDLLIIKYLVANVKGARYFFSNIHTILSSEFQTYKLSPEKYSLSLNQSSVLVPNKFEIASITHSWHTLICHCSIKI